MIVYNHVNHYRMKQFLDHLKSKNLTKTIPRSPSRKASKRTSRTRRVTGSSRTWTTRTTSLRRRRRQVRLPKRTTSSRRQFLQSSTLFLKLSNLKVSKKETSRKKSRSDWSKSRSKLLSDLKRTMNRRKKKLSSKAFATLFSTNSFPTPVDYSLNQTTSERPLSLPSTKKLLSHRRLRFREPIKDLTERVFRRDRARGRSKTWCWPPLTSDRTRQKVKNDWA
jgi:hypothetical protein